jgi:uncharacterized Zn finger protein
MGRYSRSRYDYYDRYPRYVPVAERRAAAAAAAQKAAKGGTGYTPVNASGNKMTSTFWGQAWQKHLESFSDYENRLPRGRSYLRNGSVIHLAVEPGAIIAKVQGSSLYTIKIEIAKLPAAKWKAIREKCAGGIGSLLELLQGKLSNAVMTVVTDRQDGLFPQPNEIMLGCSCPDSARMCKHVAAAMYGVGCRLDSAPELLFKLRGVDHTQLVGQETARSVVDKGASRRTLDTAGLADVFGIDMDVAPVAGETTSSTPVKKPVGRSRQTAVLATPAAVPVPAKKPVGRPRKTAVPAPIPIPPAPAKRPVGRPRKSQVTPPPPVTASAKAPAKRPVGRPRKTGYKRSMKKRTGKQ